MVEEEEEEEERDFYLENSQVVFTATYLLRRGFCCSNGCRHCPYKKERKKERAYDENPQRSY